MSLGEPRKEKDKSGGECWAAEVAINSKWFEVMAASQVISCLLSILALVETWIGAVRERPTID